MDDVAEFAAEPLRFFSHDADAAADPKCRRLIRRYGARGYGMWWMLCEALASSVGHYVQIQTDNDTEDLAVLLECDEPDEAVEFVRYLERIGLVTIDGGRVRSPRMDKNASYFGKKRASGRNGGAAKAKANS